MDTTPTSTPCIVSVLDIFRGGEFDCSLPFRTLEGAYKAAAQVLANSLKDADDFATTASVYDRDEFQEFRDNLLVLYEREDYDGMLECWDAWVADDNCEDWTPVNFDITSRVME